MDKLDAIERHANRALISTSQLDDEVSLLIRAVRQLGHTAKSEGYPEWWDGEKYRRVDDDVRELVG